MSYLANDIAACVTCCVIGAAAWWLLVRSITKRLDRIEWALRIELLEKERMEGCDDSQTRP